MASVYLPFILFGAAFLLGGWFAQSRVALLSLLMGIVTLLLNYFRFVASDPDRAGVLVLVASVYLPILTVFFYRLRERGLYNVHGGLRALVVLSVVFVFFLLAEVFEVGSLTFTPRQTIWFRRLADWLPLPLLGLLAFAAAIWPLYRRRPHESPLLGPLLVAALLCAFWALGCSSPHWGPAQSQRILITGMSAAAFALIGAVLESSWRHANMDELTDLPNRRALQHRFARLGTDYALAVVDIDHFKRINDRYGHDAGDQVLRFIAAFLKQNPIGKAYRFGGEEFVIVGRGEALHDLIPALETLRRSIAARSFGIRSQSRPHRHKAGLKPAPVPPSEVESISVTVSIGVARKNRHLSGPPEVMEAADQALYQAKQDGRNRVKAAR